METPLLHLPLLPPEYRTIAYRIRNWTTTKCTHLWTISKWFDVQIRVTSENTQCQVWFYNRTFTSIGILLYYVYLVLSLFRLNNTYRISIFPFFSFFVYRLFIKSFKSLNPSIVLITFGPLSGRVSCFTVFIRNFSSWYIFLNYIYN